MDSDTDEEQEDKNILRYDIYYLIYRTTKAIGFMRVFNVLGARLSDSINQLSNKEESGNSALLVKFEAELHCLSGALKNITTGDAETSDAIQQMLSIILNFECPKQKIVHTILSIVSKSSSFFGQRRDLLSKALKFLAACMDYKKFENEAAEAISNLCKSNKHFVMENLEDFMLCNQL